MVVRSAVVVVRSSPHCRSVLALPLAWRSELGGFRYSPVARRVQTGMTLCVPLSRGTALDARRLGTVWRGPVEQQRQRRPIEKGGVR